MTPWLTLWTRTFDIAAGTPEVISRRMSLLSQPPWSASLIAESQNMVMEKMEAASESFWALCRAMVPGAVTPPLGSLQWIDPLSNLRLAESAAQATNQALEPMSRRVNDNLDRLRRG